MGTPYVVADWGERDPRSSNDIERLLTESTNRVVTQLDFFSKSYSIKSEEQKPTAAATNTASDYFDLTIQNVFNSFHQKISKNNLWLFVCCFFIF